jgi:hypothetical protein
MNYASSKQLPVNSKQISAYIAKSDFREFVEYTKPDYDFNWHHELLIQYLQKFADGEIKKLLVFMPPQHGKSELTSRRLPAFLLGKNPTLKIIGCSYSSGLATSFNRDVQRIIDNELYFDIFPDTTLNESNVRTVAAGGGYMRNSDIFEIVKHRGFYKSVGVGGSLTGTPADIGIIDDPIKDAMEAESSTYRSRVWDWFTQVFMTRLHNDSQIIITQTRWNLDDLSGRILRLMNNDDSWTILSLPAIAEGAVNEYDPREMGEPLWAKKHSLKRLNEIRSSNPRAFHALYQQDPKPFEGGLVYSKFITITKTEFDEIRGLNAYGLDFGYNEPTAIVHCKIDLANKKLYIDEEIYRTGLTSGQLLQELKERRISRGSVLIADSARPEIIADLRHSFNVKPTPKGSNSVYYGILKVMEFDIYIVNSAKNVIFEIGQYRFKEDKDGNPTNEALGVNDHAMDAIRYAVRYLVESGSGNVLAYG